MRIRSLDDPNDQLHVFEDDQGDIYISIHQEGKRCLPVTVRIGAGNCGGPDIPRLLHQKLHEVAHEFDRFKDIQWESEAARIGDFEDDLKRLDAQIASTKSMLQQYGPSDTLMKTSMQFHLEDLQQRRAELIAKKP